MAKQIYEKLVDDIDGSEATQTVVFGVDGTAYQIDLNDAHADELRATLDPFLGAARRVRPSTGRAGRVVVADKDRNQAIRAWALESGVQLPTRGRIAGGVQAAYDAGDVPGLYAAAGLELEAPVTRRSRRRTPAAEFSAAE